MAVQEELITSLLKSGDLAPAVTAGVEPDWFDGENKKVWTFLVGHWRKHNKTPSKTALKRQCPNFAWTEIDEPTAYCIDEMIRYRQDFLLRAATSKAQEAGAFDRLESPDLVAETMQKDLLAVRRVGSASMDHVWATADSRKSRFDDYLIAAKQKGLRGILTPWASLDEMLLGWQPSQFVVTSARPGVGKTWFICLSIYRALQQGKKVLLSSNEMTELEIGRRLDALACGISAFNLRYGRLDASDLKKYRTYCAQKMRQENLVILSDDGDSQRRTGTMLIRAKIDVYQPDIVFVDGAYLLREGERSRVDNQYAISQELKAIARHYHLPLLATVQQGRPKSERESRMGGGMSGAQWSDSWAQDADVFLEMIQNPAMQSDSRMRIRLCKQRDGPLGELEVRWNFKTSPMQFTPLSTTDQGKMFAEEGDDLGLGL